MGKRTKKKLRNRMKMKRKTKTFCIQNTVVSNTRLLYKPTQIQSYSRGIESELSTTQNDALFIQREYDTIQVAE